MENDPEKDLWLEFEKLESVLNGKEEIPTEELAQIEKEFAHLDGVVALHAPIGRKSYSAIELAEAEGEREILEDRLHELLSKTDEFNGKLMSLNHINIDLMSKNDRLTRENDDLKAEVAQLRKYKESQEAGTPRSSEEKFRNIEFKLAETRAKLARTLQTFDDLSLAKDYALKELEQEKLMRIHVEKERDAYCAAYEASLTHFEKWTKASRQRSPVNRG